MGFVKYLKSGMIGVLMAVTPVSASYAAVRPGMAVPTAGSTAVSAQGQSYVARRAFPWLPIGIIAFVALLAIYIAASSDGDGRGELSRG